MVGEVNSAADTKFPTRIGLLDGRAPTSFDSMRATHFGSKASELLQRRVFAAMVAKPPTEVRERSIHRRGRLDEATSARSGSPADRAVARVLVWKLEEL